MAKWSKGKKEFCRLLPGTVRGLYLKHNIIIWGDYQAIRELTGNGHPSLIVVLTIFELLRKN